MPRHRYPDVTVNAPLLSVVIPAYNEEKLLGDCLNSVYRAINEGFGDDVATEVIVVDNNSTDATAAVAEAAGARVVFEPVNQIAGARNAGAREAAGSWLVFIDADCEPEPGLFSELRGAIDSGRYVGCGCIIRMPDIPFFVRLMLAGWTRISIICRWAAGSFLACTAESFGGVGGFNEELYAAEEIDLSRRLKRYGRSQGQRFTILRDHPILTSNRKTTLYSQRELLAQFGRLMLRPRKALREKKRLGVWYDGRR